jgi:hypothetical protein
MLVLAALAFVGIVFLAVPFPLIVITAGVIGFIAARAGSGAFQVGGDHGGGGKASSDEGLLGVELPEHARPTMHVPCVYRLCGLRYGSGRCCWSRSLSLDPWALLLSLAAMIAIFRFKVGMIQTLLACSFAGIVLYLAGLVGP